MNGKKSKKPYDDEYDEIMFSEVGSANEYTGLIPSAVITESEHESYCELMRYNPEYFFNDSDKK